MDNKNENMSVVMLGASGAVGTEALNHLLKKGQLSKLILLGRRPVENIEAEYVSQHEINIFEPSTYEASIKDVSKAICTLGVGEPSKISKEDFLKIDKQAVLDYAKVCKANGVKHFELLSSVGISATSSNFYLKSKGELVVELEKLKFERLSIFQPSMILTSTNRYGLSQAIVLKVWPILNYLLHGSMRKYRGIAVDKLGTAIANNLYTEGAGFEILKYDEFSQLS